METRHIDTLRLWDKNPRAIKQDKFNQLKERIKRWGQFKPVIITPDGEVIGGNMRLRAYKELGITDIWVSVVTPKTDAEKIEIALADNEELGYYEDDALAELLMQYQDKIELGNYSINLGKLTPLDDLLDQYQPTEIEEDEVPDVPEEPDSKLGEVYELGRHRLMCGDSTKIEDVEKLMNGQKADMVFTDPPYNVGYDYESYNDNKTSDEYTEFLKDSIPMVDKVIVNNGVKRIYEMVSAFGVPKWVGCWLKTNAMSPSSISNLTVWEPVFFYGNVGRKRNNDLYEYPISSQKEVGSHTCPKPLKLCVDIIEKYNEGEAVYDPFGGSGSTLIACEQLDRTCYMMELDPKYCDVIRKRYDNFVNKEEKEE